MADALLIIAQNHIVERHHILGIIVLNGQQIPELPGGCLLVGDTETCLLYTSFIFLILKYAAENTHTLNNNFIKFEIPRN